MGNENEDSDSTKLFLERIIGNKLGFALFTIMTILLPIGVIILISLIGALDSNPDAAILTIFLFGTVVVFGLFSIVYFGAIKIEKSLNFSKNRVSRKRRKQIREAGLDQLEEGEQALSPEELEERIIQRQAVRQTSERRRPVLAILNETPSNEAVLKKMLYKGKIAGKKCAICKLGVRKKQEIVQCPHCYNLFHYDHLSKWFEKNKDCPVCDEILVK